MMNSVQFGGRSTADRILAGIDLTGRRFLVTGCNSGLGLATLNALAANGATVIGLARTFQAASQACSAASPHCVPVACDLTDFNSIAAALAEIDSLASPLDAVVANAGVADLPGLQIRYGVEMQFLTNHIGHFMLVNGLVDLLRDGSGRVVIVSSRAAGGAASGEGIMFDNLDGRRFYDPSTFYAQSKLANALFAKELSRRLGDRGIAVNSADPGSARTRLRTGVVSRLFMKSAEQGAATQTLLAASPLADGITGEHWRDCKISRLHPRLDDTSLSRRLWEVSQQILERHKAAGGRSLRHAA